ncbi:MAG: NEL-type E3 ubiquitin ligase domain-containing protein [Limnobacter sp.]|nr:NEL-type E3 ubiquitin ligase domain-containing protein [Limnobacter sp.]
MLRGVGGNEAQQPAQEVAQGVAPAAQAAQREDRARRHQRRGIVPPEPQNALMRGIQSIRAAIVERYNNCPRISLDELRIGLETDAEIVTVPRPGRGRIQFNYDPAVPEEARNLQGYDYVDYVNQNRNVLAATRRLITQPILTKDRTLDGEALNQYIYKLKVIHAECSNSSHLANELESLAADGAVFCGDRRSYFFEQIFIKCFLNHLAESREVPPDDLFNLGVAFFKLALVREETTKYLTEGRGRNIEQNVHDYLDAEYFLQERLGLPTCHQAPTFNDIGNMNREVAARIGDRIEQRLSEKDGVEVIDYLSQWDPWAGHVLSQRQLADDIAKISEIAHKSLEDLEDNRTNPNSEFHSNEGKYLEEANKIALQKKELTREFVGQKAREFLINQRTNFLIEAGRMPDYFLRGN